MPRGRRRPYGFFLGNNIESEFLYYPEDEDLSEAEKETLLSRQVWERIAYHAEQGNLVGRSRPRELPQEVTAWYLYDPRQGPGVSGLIHLTGEEGSALNDEKRYPCVTFRLYDPKGLIDVVIYANALAREKYEPTGNVEHTPYAFVILERHPPQMVYMKKDLDENGTEKEEGVAEFQAEAELRNIVHPFLSQGYLIRDKRVGNRLPLYYMSVDGDASIGYSYLNEQGALAAQERGVPMLCVYVFDENDLSHQVALAEAEAAR